MNIDNKDNMIAAVQHLLEACKQSTKEFAAFLVGSQEGMNNYLLNKEGLTPEELSEIADKIGIHAEMLKSGEFPYEEAFFFIKFIDTLAYLSAIAPERRCWFIYLLSACIYPRKRRTIGRAAALKNKGILAETYRSRQQVHTVRAFREHDRVCAYTVCPRCNRSLERDYQSYCDRCGQALGWKNFKRAQIVFRS